MRVERLDLANWSTNTSSGRPTMAALIAQSGSGTVRIADRHRDRHWPRAGVPGPPPPGALPSDGGIGAIQARALLDGGRRELWFAALQDARVDPYGATRFQALRQFCVDEGLPPIQRVAVPLTTQGGTAAVKKMLTSGEPVGVACYNDDVAMAVLAGCRVLTVEVPTALSLVGVDHTPAGRLGSPPLTTIDTDLRGLIHHLADDLRARLGAPPLSDARLPTGFTLVRGGTT